MGQSAREPLLADDKQALDTIAESFTGGNSVMATAIISLTGEVIAQAGSLCNHFIGPAFGWPQPGKWTNQGHEYSSCYIRGKQQALYTYGLTAAILTTGKDT